MFRVAMLAAAAAGLAGISAPAVQAAPAGNGNCAVIVPASPLSAQGLATPWRLLAPCHEADPATGAFAQATIVTPSGGVAVYDPLVIDNGTVPAAPPVVPVIPPGSVVAIWTGFDGNVLHLIGPGAGQFVTGLGQSPFGQVAWDNGPAFFAAAAARHVAVPAAGTGRDGLPCPTVRDFSLVDQDPSDNVTTRYIVTAGGRTAQDTTANRTALGGNPIINPSDNALLDGFVDPALGCTPFTAPDLADPGHMVTSQGLNELLAAANSSPQGIALVPVNDPMTTVGADDDIVAGQFPTAANLSAAKTDAYRAGVGQPPVTGSLTAAAKAYCDSLNTVATARLKTDAPLEQGPQPIVPGITLNQFLVQRLAASLSLLNCKLFG